MYTEKQLVEFGNFILQRRRLNISLPEEIISKLTPISHTDTENWKESNKEKTQKLTFGQKAVGLNFNSSGDDKVDIAKQLMADAIDLLEKDHKEKTNDGANSSTWIRNVFRTAAFNAIIAAQMAVVKYLTWKN